MDSDRVIKINRNEWLSLGIAIRKMIFNDSKSGILQGKQDQYRSRDYMRKKRNFFKKRDGSNYSPYEGKTIISNHTSSVNLMLSGETIQGFHMVSSTDISASYSYNDDDLYKLRNALFYGRKIHILRDENKDKVKEILFNIIKRNIKDFVINHLTVKYS